MTEYSNNILILDRDNIMKNLMIKEVLMISSLFCSVISCKLYEKLTAKTKQALEQ